MRKSLFLFVIASVLTICLGTGCTDNKPTANDSISQDSLLSDTTATDTLNNLIAETPMPKAADELFDDFFFNFAANKKLQMKRIKFPLTVITNGKTELMQKKQWTMEQFFMRQDFYTLIFDNANQMKVVKDTTIDNVVVEKIYLKRKSVKQYVFNRLGGQWMLTAIYNKSISDSKNASFLNFYQRFSTDTAFQNRSINNPLTFTGPDPDNDFGNQTGVIDPWQWPTFAPQLPTGLIYNILYGQKYTESNQKIFVIRGIANGFETQLVFRKKKGHWKLVKLTT